MPNPYNITEVDIPGAYGAAQNARMSRMQMLLAQRQIDASERQAERDNTFRTTLARVFAPQAGQSGEGSSGVSAAYRGPTTPGQPAVSEAPGVGADPHIPAANGPRLDPAVAAQLIAIDPQQGAQIVGALRQLDEAALVRRAAANEYLARAAHHLLTISADQRAAELQRITPDLVAHGVGQDQIAGFDASDQNLRYVLGQAQDIEHLIANARPHLRNVGPGDTIIDENNPAAQPVYESPYLPGPGGTFYRRSDVEHRTLTDDDIRRMESEGGAGQPNAPGTFP